MKKAGRELQKEVYTVPEAAEILGVGVNTIYNLSHTRDFPSFRIGKRIVIPREHFLRWMDRMVKGAPSCDT
ncbi:helix-turn-helix domain-containing protein [Pseudoflavonifractor sp. An184]|uniref:helix-turn-helix domain-containing protein n=1 Tax=Pseudoflavonifractor sp. An184 TaxID=1965576 RepID=UPI000B37428B|nr:helix-turn-helix domain-containing protein [Pseudoflavonifractor sp. An184]OUP51661.1 hypothetical protein B5F19_14290 [Pseudoflavonifractor sp. An184]